MAFSSIVNVNLGLTQGVNYYLAPPFGLYALLFQSGTGFLADLTGRATSYPHRAVAFTATKVYETFPALLLSQGSSATSLDFYLQRLTTDADTFPTTTTPVNGYRVTANATQAVLRTLSTNPCDCNAVKVYLGTNPSLDPLATSTQLASAIGEAVRQVAAGALSVVIYYESAPGVFSALFTVTPVTLTP